MEIQSRTREGVTILEPKGKITIGKIFYWGGYIGWIIVILFIIGKQVTTIYMYRSFSLLSFFFNSQYHMYIGNMLEMPFQALHLGVHVVTQRCRQFDVVSCQVDLHVDAPFSSA